MERIVLKCNNCNKSHKVNHTEDIPSWAKYGEANMCPVCKDNMDGYTEKWYRAKPNPELVKKIKRAKADWGKVLKELDEKGLLVKINRVGPKNYNVIVNFEIVKYYRQRRSAKRYLTRLLTN